MILAALIAKGETVIKDIRYIDRGYEKFDENCGTWSGHYKVLIFTSSFSEKINSIRPFKSLRKILELCSFSFLIRKDGVSVFIVLPTCMTLYSGVTAFRNLRRWKIYCHDNDL